MRETFTSGEEAFVVKILFVIYASANGHELQQISMQDTKTFSLAIRRLGPGCDDDSEMAVRLLGPTCGFPLR